MKNILKPVVLILIIGSALLIQSCNNNVPALADIKMTRKATTALSAINSTGRVMNTGLVFTDVMLGVTEIEFEAAE